MNQKTKVAELFRQHRDCLENMAAHGDRIEKAMAKAVIEYGKVEGSK